MRLFDDVTSLIDDPMLRRAYELAERGRGLTSPNPIVGCVIAQDDEIVGEGFHAGAGGPHAEIVALSQAGPRAAGATAYVTLEPCNHFGKTPPCSEALVTRGIAGVVIGMADPNPVAVGGAVRLREAGIEVELTPNSTPFLIQNEAWLHSVTRDRPFVQFKTALTLDGHASVCADSRSRISGEGGGAIVARMRAAADAIIVGSSTARSDDPRLTVRATDGTETSHQPLRIVMSGTSVPDVSLFHDGHGPTAALVAHNGDSPPGVQRIEYDPERGLAGAFESLLELGIVRLLVEAGPSLLTAALEQNVADEYVFVHSGGMAGSMAPILFAGGVTGSDDAIDPILHPVESGIIEQDVVTVWRPVADFAGVTQAVEGD